MEDKDGGRVSVAGLDGRFCGDAKTEGHVAHREHDDTLVLGRVLGDTAEVRFEDVVAVQEGQLASGLDPDLGVSEISGEEGSREELKVVPGGRVRRRSAIRLESRLQKGRRSGRATLATMPQLISRHLRDAQGIALAIPTLPSTPSIPHHSSPPRNIKTHLVLCVLGQPVKRRDAELELSALGELAHAGAERDEVGARDRRGEVEHWEGEVVDTVGSVIEAARKMGMGHAPGYERQTLQPVHSPQAHRSLRTGPCADGSSTGRPRRGPRGG